MIKKDHMYPLIVVALSTQLSLCPPGNAQDAHSNPPLIPETDEVILDAPPLASACLSAIHKYRAAKDWKFGNPLLTTSKKWGAIYRVDFYIKDSNLAPLVNRVVCWRTPEDRLQIILGIGQNIPELQLLK